MTGRRQSLKTDGAPFLVAPSGSWPNVAADGTLAFVRQSSTRPDLVWVDRAGVVERVTTFPQAIAFPGPLYRNIGLAPDGTAPSFAWRPRRPAISGCTTSDGMPLPR